MDEAGKFSMFRRAKVNLWNLPDDVSAALAAGVTVIAELGLTDANGGPVCASVPPERLAWRPL